MSSKPKEWDEKVDITWREYFNPPWMLPHIGIVRLARRIEKELGKEKAHQIIKEVASELASEWTLKQVKDMPITSRDEAESVMSVIQNNQIQKVGAGKSQDGHCLWAETYKALGAEDIGYLWVCNSDRAMLKAVDPKFELAQGETLMTGNSFCDNQVSWEED